MLHGGPVGVIICSKSGVVLVPVIFAFKGELTRTESKLGLLSKISMMNTLAKNGYMGPEFEAMNEITVKICEDYLDAAIAQPSLSVKKIVYPLEIIIINY